MKAQIVKKDGTNNDANVAPTNLWLHTLFADVRLVGMKNLFLHLTICIPIELTWKLCSAMDLLLKNLSRQERCDIKMQVPKWTQQELTTMATFGEN